jgi:DNA-binding transcriptional LysR family regulator
MDLKRLRTFVAVADLGTVSKAALRLRVAQPALSRQIIDLETELGLTLFDRVGRRLLLTGEGEQLLGNCRRLLGDASSLADQAQELRRGDSGVLKVTASALMIESVISALLHRYAEHYPNVQVRLIEGIGAQVLGLVERGEAQLGIILDAAVPAGNDHFGSRQLPPVEFWAACHTALELGHGRSSAASRRIRCSCRAPVTCFARRSMRPAVSPDCGRISCSSAARRTRSSDSPKPGTAWQSSHRICGFIATV